MLYYTVFGLLTVCSFFDLIQEGKYLRFVPIVGLIFLVSLRSWNVGPDTIAYVNDFNQIKFSHSSIYNFETGFSALEKISGYFQFPIWIFFLIISTLTLGGLSFMYGKLTDLSMAALLYYYSRFFLNRDMNQIRAGLAAVILLFSIKYISSRRFWSFLFIVFIASLFHSAAAIAILVYPLVGLIQKQKKYSTFYYIFTLVIAAVCSRFMFPILNLLFDLIGKGSVYISYEGYVVGNGLMNPVIWLQTIISIVLSTLYFRHIIKEKYAATILGMYMLSTIILVLFSEYSVFSGRLSTMLATIEPIALIYILKSYLKNNLIITIFIAIISLTFFYIIFGVTGQIQRAYEPYTITFE